jgi:hypothetical protein
MTEKIAVKDNPKKERAKSLAQNGLKFMFSLTISFSSSSERLCIFQSKNDDKSIAVFINSSLRKSMILLLVSIKIHLL